VFTALKVTEKIPGTWNALVAIIFVANLYNPVFENESSPTVITSE